MNASDTLLFGFAVSKIVLEPVDGVYSSGSSHAERKDRGRERRGERERETGRKGGREGEREGERERESVITWHAPCHLFPVPGCP